MSRFVVTAAVLALTVGAAQAQTAKSASTDSKPLLENERMRVIEVVFKPRSKTATLNNPNRFVYALTDGALVFRPPGKTPFELSFKAGEALWLPSDPMVTENDGEKEVRALVVELRDVARPTRVAGKGKQRGKLKVRTARAGAAKAGAKGKVKRLAVRRTDRSGQ
jgi:hypothetical protein